MSLLAFALQLSIFGVYHQPGGLVASHRTGGKHNAHRWPLFNQVVAAFVHAHIHAHTNTYTCTHACMHTHTCMYTHTHTHTHTHTGTGTHTFV